MRASPTQLSLAVLALLLPACSGAERTKETTSDAPLPHGTVAHARWEAHAPGGIAARGIRKNLAPGDTTSVDHLTVTLISLVDSEDAALPDTAVLAIAPAPTTRRVPEGTSFNWSGYHISVLAARTDSDELGAGNAELEISAIRDLPESVVRTTVIGDAKQRIRIRHDVRMITLHHSGSAEPLRPEDSVPDRLRELQLWSETDRNWWDVPYHFLIGLDGTIYEGRDYRFRGDTNTRYDVDGHLLISVLGNYEIQDSTPEQIRAITDVMAWAVAEFRVPLDRIYGHSDLAKTSCPGKNLRKYLDDGTFRRGIRERLTVSTREKNG